MRQIETLGKLQAFMLIITSAGVLNHVIIIPILIQTSGRDSWISVLLTAVVFFMWIPLLYFIIRRSGQTHILIWLKRHTGRFAYFPILIILIEMLTVTIMTVRDVCYWTNVNYLPNTPNLFVVCFFMIAVFYIVNAGLRAVSLVNGILLPLVIFLGFFVAILNFKFKDYSLLLPILEHGTTPIFKGMLYSGAGLIGIIQILFMQHRINTKISWVPLMVIGFLLVELTIGPLAGAIAIFGPHEASRLRFTAYEEWRMITFSHYFEHVDFLSIYQWLVGAFIRCSLNIALILELINPLSQRIRSFLLIVIILFVIMGSQIQISDKLFMTFLQSVFLPGSLFVLLGISVWLFIVAYFKK